MNNYPLLKRNNAGRVAIAIRLVAMLALVPLTGLYYNKLPIDSFSVGNMVLFFVLIGSLSIVAIRNFRREKPGKEIPAA